MLPARSAEAGERVTCDVMASRDRDLADCRGHVVDGDVDESLRYLLEALRAVELVGDFLQASTGSMRIERLITVRAEHLGEFRWIDPSEEQVAVGDRQWTAVSVTGRSGIRASAL